MQRMMLFCLAYTLLLNADAQTDRLKPISIGDTIPDIPFQQVLNDSDTALRLSKLKGKLVILDFWNKTCLACLHSMPKMDSLQKKFGDKIQIILVTYNSREDVNTLFSRIKIPKPALPFVVADTVYYKQLFPHEADPLHVWIDGNGIVSAITAGHNATVSHIQAKLDGREIVLSKRAPEGAFAGSKGLLEVGVTSLKRFVSSYSILFKNLTEQTHKQSLQLVRDSGNGGLRKITAINIPLLTLYSYAFSETLFGFEINPRNVPANNRILVETNHPLDVRTSPSDSLLDEWKRRNLWSYEAERVPESRLKLTTILQSDLEQYSSFHANIEPRKVICLVLKRTGRKDKLATTDAKKPAQVYFNHQLSIQNQTLRKSLLPHLVVGFQTLPHPVIDETGYPGPVDMILDIGTNDLSGWNNALKKYGLALTKEKRTVRMLVIRDKKA